MPYLIYFQIKPVMTENPAFKISVPEVTIIGISLDPFDWYDLCTNFSQFNKLWETQIFPTSIL
jgi:hypothetical protein